MIDFGKVPGIKREQGPVGGFGGPMNQGSYGQGLVGQNRNYNQQGMLGASPTGRTSITQPQGQAQPQAQQNLGAPGPQAQNMPQQVSAQPQGGPGYNLGFNVPQQFGQAGQVYGQLAQGQFTVPQQIQQASQYANQMAQNGMPTSTQNYQQAAMPVIQKQLEDIRKQAMASANVSGMGNSTVLGQQIAQQQGDLMNQFNLGLANQQLGLDESAKQRMLSGMGMLGQLGGQELGADQFGQNMALQGAQGLQGLGQQYFNMPFQVAGQMAGLGQQYNNSLVTPLDQQYLQAMQLGTQGGGQQQYTAGFGQQVAQGLGAAAQYAPGIAQGFQSQPQAQAVPSTGVPNFSLAQPAYNPYNFSLSQPAYNPYGFSLAGYGR